MKNRVNHSPNLANTPSTPVPQEIVTEAKNNGYTWRLNWLSSTALKVGALTVLFFTISSLPLVDGFRSNVPGMNLCNVCETFSILINEQLIQQHICHAIAC